MCRHKGVALRPLEGLPLPGLTVGEILGTGQGMQPTVHLTKLTCTWYAARGWEEGVGPRVPPDTSKERLVVPRPATGT